MSNSAVLPFIHCSVIHKYSPNQPSVLFSITWRIPAFSDSCKTTVPFSLLSWLPFSPTYSKITFSVSVGKNWEENSSCGKPRFYTEGKRCFVFSTLPDDQQHFIGYYGCHHTLSWGLQGTFNHSKISQIVMASVEFWIMLQAFVFLSHLYLYITLCITLHLSTLKHIYKFLSIWSVLWLVSGII